MPGEQRVEVGGDHLLEGTKRSPSGITTNRGSRRAGTFTRAKRGARR